MRPISAMILAAGYGTRLKPLTLELPKPLLWMGDCFILEIIATQLKKAGFEKAKVNIHYLPERFYEINLNSFPLPIEYIFEEEILGTAGGIRNAFQGNLENDIFVYNSDILTHFNLLDLIQFHQIQKEPPLATLCVEEALGGNIGFDESGRVVRIRDFSMGRETRSGNYLGICVLAGKAVKNLPNKGCLIGDFMIPMLKQNCFLNTFQTKDFWIDIGTKESYVIACRLGLKPQLNKVLNIPSNIWIKNTIVGHDVEFFGKGMVENCILWPRSKVIAPISNKIVTTKGLCVSF